MKINPYLFIIPSTPNQIVWDYKNHKQFELNFEYSHRLASLIENPKNFDSNNTIDVQFFNAGILTNSKHNQVEWGWDDLSKIFHIGTKNIPCDYVPKDIHEWSKQYLDHCTNVLATPSPQARNSGHEARELIALPNPSSLQLGSLANILTDRKTCRTFTDEGVSLKAVSTLLYLSLGYLHERANDIDDSVVEGLGARRSSPSGGGLNACEGFLQVQNVIGLKPGLYAYHPLEHALSFVNPIPCQTLGQLLCGQHFIKIKTGNRDLTHRLSANHLVYFLDYTTLLEHRIVNRSVETIVYNELGIHISNRMRTAAMQLYTDEGYHALFSNSLAEQIADFYGMTDRPAMPQRIIQLNALIDRTPDKHKALTWFLIGFVSETIIAKELLDVCRVPLICSVQEMLRDHLADEAVHSRYFCEAFHYLWLHISCDERTFAAKLLLEILLIFFEVDNRWLEASLRSVGLGAAAIAQILSEMASDNARLLRARSGASATLQAMKQAGLFDLPGNRQLFSQAGLLND